MQEKIHTPEESVQIIDKMMQLTRVSVKESYWYYFFFGILVIVASLGHLALLQLNYNSKAGMIWSIMIIGGIVAAIKGARDEKNNKAQPAIYSLIWLAASLTYFTVFIGLIKTTGSSYLLVNPIVFSLAGGATFLSGKIMQFKPFVYGGLLMWLIAIAQLFVGLETQLLLNVLSVIIGYLLPAYLLKQS